MFFTPRYNKIDGLERYFLKTYIKVIDLRWDNLNNPPSASQPLS